MIRLTITRTWKSYSPRARWETFDFEAKQFDTLEEAKAWANENLPRGKRRPIYADTQSRGTIKCGYVIGYRVEEPDRHAREGWSRYLAQDWIAFEEIIRHPAEGRPGEVRSIAL